MSSDGDLRPLFREHLRRGFDWQSIETGMTVLGCPDANYCAEGIEGWVEFKQTSGWVCTLRPEQAGWHYRRHLHGGRSFIATRRWHSGGSRLGAAVDELWVHAGMYARELKTDGLRGVPALFRQDGGPSAWDWDAVRGVLLT